MIDVDCIANGTIFSRLFICFGQIRLATLLYHGGRNCMDDGNRPFLIIMELGSVVPPRILCILM